MKRVLLFCSVLALAGVALAETFRLPAGAREIKCPDGPLEKVIASEAVSESAGAFTVAFRFRPLPYKKRPGPSEGLVFANGNGWNTGFRVTLTPLTDLPEPAFRMGLRVVTPQGKGVHVSLGSLLRPECWRHIAFVFDGKTLKCYADGTLSSSCPYTDATFKRAQGRFTVGPAGFGVGYYPFAASSFTVWTRALSDVEVLSLATGGKTAPAEVAEWLKRLDAQGDTFARPLAWTTARRLFDAGARRQAAELYALLAARAPDNSSIDGGNEAAAIFAQACDGRSVAPAVKVPQRVPFAGYAPFVPPSAVEECAGAVYVAPDGSDDSGTGTKERPFATITRALDAVRGKAVRRILLRGGRYALAAGVKVGSEDSGTAQSPLIIAAVPGETPILDGGREVTGFVPCGRGAVLEADLRGKGFSGLECPRAWGYALSGKGERHILDLYENDSPCELARHPNSGFVSTTWVDKKRRLFKVDVPDLADWANEPYLMALSYMRWLWGDETTRLSIDPVEGTLQIDTNLIQRVAVGRPVKFVNSLRALDEPGEWFLDYGREKLFFWPRTHSARVVLSQLAEPILSLDGVSHLEIRNLTLECGRSSGLKLSNCSHVRILGNVLRNLGQGISATGEDIVIRGNRLRSFARGGITVRGGDRPSLAPSGIRILRNEVSDVERKVRTYCPCVHAEGVGVEIAYNHFHDAPSSAIRLEGNDMLVNSNLVERCVLESDDQGAIDIYANPTYAGIDIIGNTWRDIGRGGRFAPCGQAAVRFDDVISGVRVRLNRFYRCGIAQFGAVQINGGRLNVIDNNLFVDCRRDCSINRRSPSWWEKTMTSGYCAPKIAAVKPALSPWKERYPYVAEILSWPAVNYISRNIYVRTPHASRSPNVNGNIHLDEEPQTMPPGYDRLGPAFRLTSASGK